MTTNQYYKQVNDASYLISYYTVEGNDISATVDVDSFDCVQKIIDGNNFFALENFNEKAPTTDAKFTIKFVVDGDNYDVYKFFINSVIDGRFVSGCNLVLNCSGAILDDSVRNESEDCASDDSASNDCFLAPFGSLIEAMDNFRHFRIPSLDNFVKRIEKMTEKMTEMKNCDVDYCSVTCNFDGKGNGYYRKVDKNGVVEKSFKRIGNEIKEIGNRGNVNVNETDVKKDSDVKKASLKDML